MAEWSKALAWKVSIRQNRIEGSNPSRSATTLLAAIWRSKPETAQRVRQWIGAALDWS